MTFRELVPVGAIVERVRKELLKILRLRLITTLVVLGCWGGPGVLSILAQNHPSASALVQKLQSEQTTDNARDELLKLGRSDREVRQYLMVHLPPLIEVGPGACAEELCRAWSNAVELAGKLKIGEAAPGLARWITVRNTSVVIGIGPEARLYPYPAARAMIGIGDTAIPALQTILDQDNTEAHFKAVRVLCMIHSSKAKAVLRDDLQHEPDLDLQAMIKIVLEEK